MCVLLNPYRTKNQKPSPMLEISCVINWIYPNFYFVVYWCLLIIIRSLVWLQTNLAEELAHLPCCHIIYIPVYPVISHHIPLYILWYLHSIPILLVLSLILCYIPMKSIPVKYPSLSVQDPDKTTTSHAEIPMVRLPFQHKSISWNGGTSKSSIWMGYFPL